MKIRFKKMRENAVEPQRAHSSDAGYDLTAAWVKEDDCGNVVYGCGVAVEIPPGYVGLVFPRSSVAKKRMLLSNGVGVIDSGYRGEILAKFKPTVPAGPLGLLQRLGFVYEVGDRIAQMVVMKLPEVEFEEAEELGESDRGEGGYGSTGN